jgi:pSer/pThr/pTyr-binding forkhead associated (FHA) protein
MAKLYLKFEQAVLKEVPLSQGVITIGRLPDNTIPIDNLAVSGHHAKIYWDSDHYVLEDNNSLNGTYVNNARISRHALKDGDSVLIGKHTLAFKDEWHEDKPGQGAAAVERAAPMAKLEHTMVLDTKKMKEMLAGMGTQAPGAPGAPKPAAAPAASATGAASTASTGTVAPTQHYPPPAAVEKIGVLNVIDGKTDQNKYLLTGKMSVIGKSDMASIKLKGWFAPKMAAIISKRDNAYVIAASEQNIKVKINGEQIAGQKNLSDGDMIEVAGIKMTFGLQ